MASTRDAYGLGKADGFLGKPMQEVDKRVQAAYDQGYQDGRQARNPKRHARRVVQTPHNRPFNLGP